MTKDISSGVGVVYMTKTCTKCKNSFDEKLVDDPGAQKYSSCPSCWNEWTTHAIMVINELRLDMSLPEHRKALKKQEKIFFGLEQGEQIQKNPDNP
jgi:Fe-S cluster biosynthesis and repair protein YggX